MINKFRGDYYFLSNFYECDIMYEGILFKNSESVFQAMKCENYKDRLEFTNLSGGQAKYKGKRVKLRPNWNDIRLDIMYDVVKAKFTQNEELKYLLLNTGDTHLEEGNNHRDTFYGTYKGKGHNHLGKILMQVRDEIRIYENYRTPVRFIK